MVDLGKQGRFRQHVAGPRIMKDDAAAVAGHALEQKSPLSDEVDCGRRIALPEQMPTRLDRAVRCVPEEIVLGKRAESGIVVGHLAIVGRVREATNTGRPRCGSDGRRFALLSLQDATASCIRMSVSGAGPSGRCWRINAVSVGIRPYLAA